MSEYLNITRLTVSTLIQIPIWITGLYWGVYWIPNTIFKTSIHPGEDVITSVGGTIIILTLGYMIVLFMYGFIAYSFNLPKPFCNKHK